MLGLANRPHPPLADLFQEQVIPQHERLPFALPNLLGLKPGQLALSNQFAQQLLTVPGRSLWGQEILERVASENPAVFEVLYKLFKGNSHPRGPAGCRCSGSVPRIGARSPTIP